MELIERSVYLDALRLQLKDSFAGNGHSLFIMGDAGIGKTALVKTFIKEAEQGCEVFIGRCDSLFTPRPLAPLYDIAMQAEKDLQEAVQNETDRTKLFAAFLQYFNSIIKPIVVVIEDIHWADEATLDFIKFFARRISSNRCLFILTLRDNELRTNYALRDVLGDLSPDIVKKITVQPLSQEAVEKMAAERGYSGEDVYKISGGIPFYVNEILASYSTGVPENIKDSVLTVFNKLGGVRRDLWELFSVIPDRLEISLLDKMGMHFLDTLDGCISLGIFVIDGTFIRFKHELYRRTIEEFLSPLKRMALNKKMLDLLMDSPLEATHPERIVHFAKNGHVYDVVFKYAPLAAAKAAKVGAHIEASKLYLTAIEYAPVSDPLRLVELYEQYAYECYLVNQMEEAIIYQQKALNIWKEKGEKEKTGNSLRFLSRLWWFKANRKRSEQFGVEAVNELENEPASAVKAMVYSNMAQLKMLSEELDASVYWGNKAVEMAKELQNDEILSHALCNVGAAKMKAPAMRMEGQDLLQESLSIALQKGYQEHVARAYTNLGTNAVLLKEYSYGRQWLDEGIRYSDDRDLTSWSKFMLSWKAQIFFETGNWTEAAAIASRIAESERNSPVIVINALIVTGKLKTRRGEAGAIEYLERARAIAFPSGEIQRIAPVMIALLEYEWHTGQMVITPEIMDATLQLFQQHKNALQWGAFGSWLFMARNIVVQPGELLPPYRLEAEDKIQEAITCWRKLHCPFEEALLLFKGNDEDKRKALTQLQEVGATATAEKMKQLMRAEGIRHIPRGIRESTKTNPAQLTNRQVDVLRLLNAGLQNKEIADKLYISAKTVDHHISAILFKLDVNTRNKAVSEGVRLGIIK